MIPAPDIPGHTVTGVLGSGGFATVYRTWQVAVGRETAVKVDSRVLHTQRDQRRFIREVTAAGRLSGHPHVIDVYDAGTLQDGRPYLVMELCPDGSLNDELRRNGPMSAELVCRIGTSLADALAAAHATGILHRDIKPGNILINRYGVVGLADFGLASIIATSGEQSVSREALTPAYAPPESFDAADPTVAADLYSLAATLYTLMAGRPPRFPADSRSPTMAAILALHTRPVEDIAGVPGQLLDIVRQCLAADPAQRPPSAAALRDELGLLLGQPGRGPAGGTLSPAGLPPQPPASMPRSPQARDHQFPTVADQPSFIDSPHAGPMSAAAPPTSGPHARSGQGWAGTAPPAGPGGPTWPGPGTPGYGAGAVPGRRGRPVALAGAIGAVVALVIAGALLAGSHLFGPRPGTGTGAGTAGSGPAGTVGSFGIATTTSHCPAASVPAAGARCPSSPECWNGILEAEGTITANSLPCDGPHTWQTFAIGIMPSDASAFNVNIVQASPTVRAVCSYAVLLRSRAGRARLIPRHRWMIQVAPPDEAAYDSGIRTYRCLASSGFSESRKSQFGR